MTTSLRNRTPQRHSILRAIAGVLIATGSLPAQEKGKWIPISQDVTSRVKPGYPGKTAGVTVDPATGDVFMVVPDQGIWKSTNRGETFVGKDGFHESTDSGDTWKHVCSLPPDFSVATVGPNYAWDTLANVFYASSMGKDTFKFER